MVNSTDLKDDNNSIYEPANSAWERASRCLPRAANYIDAVAQRDIARIKEKIAEGAALGTADTAAAR